MNTVPPRAHRQLRRVLHVTIGIVTVLVLFVGFFFLNSSKDTCGLVGCPGWCQTGGISCGMPIPPGGWHIGQTGWSS